MRNLVRTLTVGALVGCFSGGLAYAADPAVATFIAKANQKVVRAGQQFTVDVSLQNVQGLGALQFMMKATGGTQGKLTVIGIEMNKERSDYVFGTASAIEAIDGQQWRAGAVLMDGSRSFDSASVATVTFEASKNATGTFQVNVAKGQETFLRKFDASPLYSAIGKDVTITVSDRMESQRPNKRKGR